MPLPKKLPHTSDDYWSLPEGERAELIGGRLYAMTPPSRIHQKLIIEIVSPGSRKMDYSIKNMLYSEANVREYWIIDPEKERTTVYHYEDDAAPIIYTFAQNITVGIYEDLSINVSDLLK